MKNLYIKLSILVLSLLSTYSQVFYGPPGGQGTVSYAGGGAGTTYVAGTGISITGNTISATGTNVAVVVYDTTQFTTNGAGALEIINGALMTNIVVTAMTNSGLTASSVIGADATKKIISISLGTGLNLNSGTLSVTTIGATAGSVINTGASLDTALPEYSGITGTNIIPSKILINGLTNISLGTITITNKATADNVVITNGAVVGSLTNNSLTASTLLGSDSTKKEISISVGDGLTNSANTLQISIAAGANITFTTNAGRISIAGAASGSGGTVGSVINTGASVATQVPVYNDTSGTNVVPSNVTITSKTNLAVGTLTVTNTTTFGDGTTAALEAYPVGGTITNAANNVGLTNAILSVFNSNVIFQASITNSSLTASQLIGTDSTKKEISIAVGNGLTNSAGTSLSVAIVAGANITITTNAGQLSIAGAASGSGAIVNTILNTGGASLSTALPEYADTSATNLTPSKILVNGLTNLSLGTITVTNQATFDNIVVTNGATFGNITNNGATASTISVFDSTKKLVSGTAGTGLLLSGTTLSVTNLSAIANTVLNSGASTVSAIPQYTDTSGTNIQPTTVLLTTKTNIQNVKLVTAGAGGTNTLSQRKYLVLDFDRVALTSMIANTNDFSLNTYGRIGFVGNSALTNNNFAEYSCIVPKYIDTASDLIVEYVQVKTSGTQTGAITFDIGMADIADSADADPTSFSNWIVMTSGTLTSPVANDTFTITSKTLTSWKSSLTAGHRLKIRMDRNDTNTDTMNLKNMLISYVETQ